MTTKAANRGSVDAQPIEVGRFPLLRYSIVATVVVLALLTVLIGTSFVRAADTSFETRSEKQGLADAEHIAQIFFHSVWSPVHEARPDLAFSEAVIPQMMDVFAQRSTFGLGVVGLNVWGSDGSLIWGSDANVPRVTAGAADWYTPVAMQGETMSNYQEGKLVSDLQGNERSLDVVQTFYPIRDTAPDAEEAGTILGVLEVNQDVTEAALASSGDAFSAALEASIIAGAILLVVLSSIILVAHRYVTGAYRRVAEKQRQLDRNQAQHTQSIRLMAVGELVASVAHELNNPLTAIWGLSQIASKRETDPKLHAELVMIHDEAERSTRIVQNLLSFARARESEKAYTSVNAAVSAAIDLRRYHMMVNNIILDTRMAVDLPRTMADPHKIQQVALNLIMNAEQAMIDANGGGRLVIITEWAGDSIWLRVLDDGPGIPSEDLEEIFNPFFSTKDDGQGTGLGLSICYSIIQEHGGSIEAVNRVEGGTEFIAELPLVAEEAGPEPAKRTVRGRARKRATSESAAKQRAPVTGGV
ncbi:MAG: ATP-binding protein [Dehalococcoidia bacterium]